MVLISENKLSWSVQESIFPRNSSVCAEFAIICEQQPDAIALKIGRADDATSEELSYRELSKRAANLARQLVSRGIKPGDRVAFATQRNFDVVIAMLAILQAGGVYVPLDLTLPKRRVEFILKDSSASVVLISQGMTLDHISSVASTIEIINNEDEDQVSLPVNGPMDPAYIIYTSGSTGEPKGVVTPHRAILRLTKGASYTKFGPDRRVLQMAPVFFDAATFEIWGTLLNGGTCVIYPDVGMPDLERMRGVLANAQINTLWLTSSLFNSIIDRDAEILGGVQELLVGGEALSVQHIRKAQSKISANLINGYGPTESTTFACCYQIPPNLPDDLISIPIGHPIENTSVLIVDEEDNPVCSGQIGALLIAGDGLAIGYLDRPELTEERFVESPTAPGGRFYRTGDLVKPLCSGEIEYVGRKDTQIKIAGNRVELGEIEQALASHPDVSSAAVTMVKSENDVPRLMAWYVPVTQAAENEASKIRTHLEARLPKYMLPSAIAPISALPLTPAGKLDRAALNIRQSVRPSLEQRFVAPRGEFEKFIAKTWCDLIGIDRVGRYDRFFELGGTSLMAMRFLDVLRQERDQILSVANFFDGPTVQSISSRLDRPLPATKLDLLPKSTHSKDDRIAIVGLAGRFAGANDISSFWDMLVDGRSGRCKVTGEDLKAAGLDPSLLDDPDYVAAAFPLDDAEGFDAAFFGFAPREAQLMDPQQRILLETAWSALEDAGHNPHASADRVGVFAGVGRNAYLLNNLMSHKALRDTAADYNMLIGNERDFPSTHIAFRFGLRGPAITVQTACSTSGVAIHLATQSLQRGECDLALAGGAKVLVPNRAGYHCVEGGPLASDGYIRAFDAEAKGMVRGSGSAMIALKRLDDAIEAGDHIYSVLIGSAINNDGDMKAGFTAPSVSGQAAVISEAHLKAAIESDTVSMIEAHGTGTVLGDPIEFEGLVRAFARSGNSTAHCALGSVKTNIGHLDAGATAASVIKTALALKNEVIPPSLNFSEPNPSICFEDSPFYVADKVQPWKRGDAPRRAGVSSFGLGGTNAHLLLEEAPMRVPAGAEPGPHLLVLSAKTETALKRRCEDLADWLEKNDACDMADVANTLKIGRQRFQYRTAFLCADRAQAIVKLRDQHPKNLLRTQLVAEAAPTVFLFPGGGAQYVGMAKDLYDTRPVFRAALDACAKHFRKQTKRSLIEIILQSDSTLEEPSVALPALFAVEYAMARLWQSWGVRPEAMIGHSMGEYTAACLAGVFSLRDAMDIVLCRGRLFETLQPGTMLSVPLSEAELTQQLGDDLSIAAINRPDQSVAAGPVASSQALAAKLEAQGIETRRVHINVAAHSTLVEPILEEFGAQFQRIKLATPQIPFLSNVTGDWIADSQATDPEYWVRHLRSTVRFSDGIEKLLEEPERIFLEIGPGQTLSSFARQHKAHGPGHEILATLRHPQEKFNDEEFLMASLGKFWLAGGQADWDTVSVQKRNKVPLPTYPYERKRLWIDAVPFADEGQAFSPAIAEDAVQNEQMLAEVAESEPLDRRERILTQLKQIIQQLSGLAPDQIDEYATFLELGFDSLFLTQANAAFKKAFKVKLTTRQLLETTPGLDLLATFLDESLDPDDKVETATLITAPTGSVSSGAAKVRAEDSPGRPVVQKSKLRELSPEQERHIDELVATTTARTPKAKASTQASRSVLADPRTVQGFRTRWKEMVYPVLSDKAKGSKVWDIDGNEYVDLVGGYGVTMFGHQPDFVAEAIRNQLGNSLAIGPQTVLAGQVANLVSELTGMERVAFCNTGSEAVLAAVRMARTVTGRSKIAKFDGHYHGIFDEMQVRAGGTGSRVTTLPSAPGIPFEAIQNTVILEYGDPDAFKVLREQVEDLAAVLVEPVRSRNPDYQPREYLQALREITTELGIPLIFDEIVTGFRSHPGGAQAIFDVRADIVTYGKVAGGGLPIGIVSGKSEFMDSLDGGMWDYGDDSVPMADMTWFAGTFVRHPLSLAATRATLEHLKREGPSLQEKLNARSAKLAADLNTLTSSLNAPIVVEQFSSVLRVSFVEHQEYADLLFFHLRNKGILTYEGRPIFLTTAHSEEDFEKIYAAFADSLKSLIAVDLLAGHDPTDIRKIPMAIGQQEIWVSAQFSQQASCSYNLCSTLMLTGDFSQDVLQDALNDLADRHEALRSVPDRDGLTQTIRPELTVPLKFEDLSQSSPNAQTAQIEHVKRLEVTVPFDLVDGPLVRSHVVRLSDNEHLLLLTVHHVIADGWSCGVLLRDLGILYGARQAGEDPSLEPAQQLSDYVHFQLEDEQHETRKEARDYWLDLYQGEFPRVDFPSDRPRPKTRDYSSSRIELPLPQELVSGLRNAALENGTTLFASLIGGFAAYLTRITGVTDNPIGFSAAGQPLLGGKNLVGHCVNFLPLRLSTDLNKGFSEHLREIGLSVLDALEHQNFDFVSFVQEVRPNRDADWAPLVSVGVNLDPSAKAMTFADFDVQAGSVGRAYEHLDLFLNFVETGSDVELQCTFNSSLFEMETIERRLQEYLRLLAEGATTPERPLAKLDIVGPTDRQMLLAASQDVSGGYDAELSVTDVFQNIAANFADKTAVVTAGAAADTGLTYADLDKVSHDWATRLNAAGVKQGDSVAVMLPRSSDFIVAILAILKLGASYVPVEPGTPRQRLNLILNDSRSVVIVTHSSLREHLPANELPTLIIDDAGKIAADALFKLPVTRGSDPAYIMYTSGSTGIPKGVVVPHRAIARLVVGADYAQLDDTRTIAQFAPTSFDASTFEIWGALLNGGTLAIIPGQEFPQLNEFGDMLRTEGVTTLWLTAALFNTIVDEAPDILTNVEELLTGGEALSVPHVCRALEVLPNTTIINGYGPTENTTFTCCYRIPRDFSPDATSIPIGKPIANTRAFIVDGNQQLLPQGVPGELLAGGDGLAIGYQNQPELTAVSFVSDQVSASDEKVEHRLYRTGDICRLRPDGLIEYLGRRDSQIKVRGFRIEPSEIESALARQSNVHSAAVIYQETGTEGELVAFVSCDTATVSPASLKKALREELPRHLIPSRIYCLPTLPVTTNGKVDRSALTEIALQPIDDALPAAPETETERDLVQIWNGIFQEPVTSVEHSFFDLGGHSLMAVRLLDRVAKRFQTDMPISILFSHPTIRELASEIDKSNTTTPQKVEETGQNAPWDPSVQIHPGPDTTARPLFIVGGAGGNVNNLMDLGQFLGKTRPVIGFQSRGIMGHTPHETIEDIASDNITYLRRHQPVGPYVLAGYSAGALTAFEMARQLKAAGQDVSELILLDTFAPGFAVSAGGSDAFETPVKLTAVQRLRDEAKLLRDFGFGHLRSRITAKLSNRIYRGRVLDALAYLSPTVARSRRSSEAWFSAARKYSGAPYSGSVSLVLSKPTGMKEEILFTQHPTLGWSAMVTSGVVEVKKMDCSHLDMVKGEYASILGDFIEKRIENVVVER